MSAAASSHGERGALPPFSLPGGRPVGRLDSITSSDTSFRGCHKPRGSRFGIRVCGKCPGCQGMTRWRWTQRCKVEISKHPRNWFLTLTSASGSSVETFRDEFQKFIKRLRKAGAAEYRYFAVYEMGGKHGRLHMHAILHCSSPVGRRQIEDQWPLGFSKCKLVAEKHAHYVAKYVGKDNIGPRPLNSVGYGAVLADDRVTDLLAAVAAHFPAARIAQVRVANVGRVPKQCVRKMHQAFAEAKSNLPPAPRYRSLKESLTTGERDLLAPSEEVGSPLLGGSGPWDADGDYIGYYCND